MTGNRKIGPAIQVFSNNLTFPALWSTAEKEKEKWTSMFLPNTESDRKSEDDYKYRKQCGDRAAQIIAQQFGLTLPHAQIVAQLAGLGNEGEVRR